MDCCSEECFDTLRPTVLRSAQLQKEIRLIKKAQRRQSNLLYSSPFSDIYTDPWVSEYSLCLLDPQFQGNAATSEKIASCDCVLCQQAQMYGRTLMPSLGAGQSESPSLACQANVRRR